MNAVSHLSCIDSSKEALLVRGAKGEHLTRHPQRLSIRLKEAIQVYKQRTGCRLTYKMLSVETGLSLSTIQSMATRKGHVTSLRNIEKLCIFLGCTPGDLLVIETEV